MTLIGPGTWEAVRAALDCARTAADLIASEESRSAYALCRPPGHHVTRSAYGGSCYLNNAAVAAQSLRDGGAPRVAIIDIDAHHGNGTQSIFYARGDVFYGSVHVDPAAGWFPHVVGFADETGLGEGEGRTLNVPIAPGSGDSVWAAAVSEIAARVADFDPAVLVVSLGVDAAAADPESPLQVSVNGYRQVGEILAGLDLPTVHVQEGGYDLASIGTLVAAFLSAFPV
jgi:acetoin utilization deacetylase AcuC-like enzyme